jgi:hypothetical protein
VVADGLPVLKSLPTVTLVILTELPHQLVDVLMVTMNHQLIVNVNFANTSVKLVTLPLNVMNVLETESNSHSVLVNQVLSMMVLNSVNLALTDA